MSELKELTHIPAFDLMAGFRLRAIRPSDAKDFFAYTANPEVGKYVLVDRLASEEEAKEEIAYRANLFRQQRAIFWAIVDAKEDKMIGWVGFYIQHHYRRGELAYELSQDYWHQGIMGQAVKTITRYGMQFIDFVRIDAIIMAENIASHKLLVANGFRHEGTLHAYKYFRGKPYDVEILAHTKQKYLADKHKETE